MPEGKVQPLPDPIRADMTAFVDAVAGDKAFKPSDFKMKMKPEEAIARLVAAYGL